MLTLQRLQSLLTAFPNQTIGLVGDLFLDRYLEIEPGVREISIETGLEAYQVTRVRNSPGVIGTVINNLAALGVGKCVPVSVIGEDGHGDDLLRELARLPVDRSHVLATADRLTPTYTKPLKQDDAGVWRELNRLDVRTRGPVSDSVFAAVCEHVRAVFHECDGLIVLDQMVEDGWGVIDVRVRDFLAQLTREQPEKLMYVDSRAHLSRFTCGVLKGNRSEVTAAAALPDDDDSAQQAAESLAQRTGQPVFCTLGQRGILIARPHQGTVRVPGVPIAGPVDIVGAGDSASSGIVASLLAGADETEAAAIGNLVASITVQQLGTTGTASPEQVIARWREAEQIGKAESEI